MIRCALIVAAWAIGVPAALAVCAVAFGGFMLVCTLIAQHFGYSEPMGVAAGAVLLFIMLGAAIGVLECQSRRA